MSERPSIEVAVIMRHERIDNRWQPWRWVLDDVVPSEPPSAASRDCCCSDERRALAASGLHRRAVSR